jgi:hypothetical protein
MHDIVGVQRFGIDTTETWQQLHQCRSPVFTPDCNLEDMSAGPCNGPHHLILILQYSLGESYEIPMIVAVSQLSDNIFDEFEFHSN